MKKFTRPPIILPEQFRAINLFFQGAVARYNYAAYFELVAYPNLVAEHVRLMRLKDIDIEHPSVCGVPVLKATMSRLVKHLVRNGISKPNDRVFNFSRQMATKMWRQSLQRTGISSRAVIRDYKEAFNTYLRTHHPNYDKK